MDKKKVICKLNLTERDNLTFSDMRKEMIEEDICNLPDIYEDEIRIDKIYTYKDDFGVEVSTIVRNATNVKKSYDMVPLVLKNKDGKVVAAKMFDVQDLSDISSSGARPYSFRFDNEYIYDNEMNLEECILEESNDIDDFKVIKLSIISIPAHFSKEEIFNINRKAKVTNDQLQMIPIEFGTDAEGVPYAIILINNGTKEEKEILVIPLTVKDASDNIVISDLFKVDVKNIKPLASTIYTLFFYDKDINEKMYDFTGVKMEFGV